MNLSEWCGNGSDNIYKWKDGNYKVKCEYISDEHKLRVEAFLNDKSILEVVEKVHMERKPNIFAMRLTSNRIINGEIKD